MKQDIPKAYNAQNVEDSIYKVWEESGFFNPDNLKGDKTFTISMPPPNATGQLHIGHAMFLTLQDLMIRYHRMLGEKTLWLPGTDHAAIATNAKVEKLLKEEGKTKYDLGQEKFIARVQEYIKQSQGTIRQQIRKVGSSCDWSRERYTMDEGLTKAVQTVFLNMYKDGLIYKGYRIVNWCPHCESTLADDEVEHKDQPAKLYYIKYGPFVVATSRPETKLGDTGVAVHPKDQRYKKYIGQIINIDLAGHKIKIKVFADKEVDQEFGTGAIGVTSAHSLVDFAFAEKHDLEKIQVINEKGTMTKAAGKYAGQKVLEARKNFLSDLSKAELLVKEEDYTQATAICYRCGTAVEPLMSSQWFVKVESLKKKAITAVKSKKIKIIPERFNKIYFQWMENLHDWCISRQIWFGHRMPVWYKKDDKEKNNPIVQIEDPGKGYFQESDTLDTWFSSGLWTFSTLGWPGKTEDFKNFHPTTVMETGYDIIFFWVARMILMSEYALQEIPFKTVYLHGLVRTRDGKKMSKSHPETCIDPLDAIKKYGCDALRMSLVVGNSAGNDLKIYDEKIENYRNFVNKLWNVSRYILMSSENLEIKELSINTLADQFIISRLQNIISSTTNNLNNFNFGQAGEDLYDFVWHDFADWYIEITKFQPNKEMLLFVLENILKLLHPFIPFVTEEIWKQFKQDELLMIEEWPKANNKLIDNKAEKEFDFLKDIIIQIRNLRSQYKIEPKKIITVYSRKKYADDEKKIIEKLGRCEIKVEWPDSKNKTSELANSHYKFSVVLGDLIDTAKEKKRLQQEIDGLKKYLTGLEKRLSNTNFIKKAPKNIVAQEKIKLAEKQKLLKDLKDNLDSL
ncbi:MAG: valine--tRNA ligase [Patescibacteria group bacterium]|jgi:valyl-tRNA synthetase